MGDGDGVLGGAAEEECGGAELGCGWGECVRWRGLYHRDWGHVGECGGVDLGQSDCVYLRVEVLGCCVVEGVRCGVWGEVLSDLG